VVFALIGASLADVKAVAYVGVSGMPQPDAPAAQEARSGPSRGTSPQTLFQACAARA
jgi:hypothetical protein